MGAKILADYIVSKCMDEQYPITNLQLQKIMYYIQKYFIHNYEKPLYSNKISAWKFGPVIPDVYYEYSSYGSLEIVEKNPQYKKLLDNFNLDMEQINNINEIIETKRELEPWDLVKETHKKGGAWDRVYNSILSFTDEITVEDIRKYG